MVKNVQSKIMRREVKDRYTVWGENDQKRIETFCAEIAQELKILQDQEKPQ